MRPPTTCRRLAPRNTPPKPQAILPLPNVPIYYSLWRVWSHRCAGKGARALLASLEVASDEQRRELAARLAALQASGQVTLRPGEWPARLVAELAPRPSKSIGGVAEAVAEASPDGSSDSSSSSSGGGGGGGGSGGGDGGGGGSSASTSSSSSGGGSPEEDLGAGAQRPRAPVFVSDGWLEDVADPAARQSSLLPESAVAKIVERWRQDHLIEHFRAAERLCLKDTAPGGSGGGGGQGKAG
jgi:hypothetical protein